MNEQIIRVEDIFSVLIKRWKAIVSISIIAVALSAALSFFVIKPKYEAKTKMFIGKEINAIQDQSYDNNDVQMYQKLLKTYAEVIMTNDLIGRAIERKHIELKSKDILNNLTVTPRADTQILEIRYVNTDPDIAKEVVSLLSEEFIEYSTELIPNGNVKIIEEVRLPEYPISPNKKVNIVIAFFAGLLISIGLCFLIEYMNNTFRTKEEIEDIIGLPTIGVIPDEYSFE